MIVPAPETALTTPTMANLTRAVIATATAANAATVGNASVLGQFGMIPKRVPIDNVEWMEDGEGGGGGGGVHHLTRDELERLYGERDFGFYLVLTLLTLGFVSGILFLYICFCTWAMKGKMDLPLPGGGGVQKPTTVIKFVNPFKQGNMTMPSLPAGLASMLRYKSKQPQQQDQPSCQPQHSQQQQQQHQNNNSHNPPGGGGLGNQHRHQTATIPNAMLNASDDMVAGAAAGTSRMIPTISNSQQQHGYTTNSGQQVDRYGHHQPPPNKLFDRKSSIGLPDSFKQFQQFRYDPQMDDEPEQVVFDIFDPQ